MTTAIGLRMRASTITRALMICALSGVTSIATTGENPAPPAVSAPPPRASVRIVAPSAAEVAYGAITLRAAVIPPTGTRVLRVDFLVDGVLVASDPMLPYTAFWDVGKSLSSHLFRAVARFADGTSAEDLITTRGLAIQEHELVEGTAIERVQLLVSVTNPAGAPATGLSAADFDVREGNTPVAIKSFRVLSQGSDIPLSIAVLVDRSGSMGFQMKRWAEACLDLLSTLRPIDQVRVSAFADETVILQDFTHDAASLAASLSGISSSGGSTSLFRAVYETVRDMRDLPGRKALILMTDGLDTEFTSPSAPIAAGLYPILNETIRTAIRSGVTIILILPGPTGAGYLAVQDLALQTGGWYMYPSADLRGLMVRLGQRLLSAYLIEYDVSRPRDADRKRPIKVTVRGEKAAGLDVRASLGTYARLDTQVMLKNDLQVGNSRQRARAAMDLARSGGPEIVPDLIKALKDDDAQVRAAAAAALAERREPQAMERILKLIHDVDPGVRDAAFEAAVRYGAAALPPLEEIARKGGPARAGALRALGDIGDPNALPALRAGLSEKDCALRAAAADGLGWLGALSGEGVPGGPHAGGTEGGGVADLLKQSLADPCPAAAEASALSLGRISDRAALPKLLEIASADPASARLPEVLRALANYATLDAVAAVERRLQAPDPIGPAAREAAAALYATSARAGEPLHRSEALKRLVALGGEEAMNAIRLVIEARPGESFDPEWQAQLEAALRKVVAGE